MSPDGRATFSLNPFSHHLTSDSLFTAYFCTQLLHVLLHMTAPCADTRFGHHGLNVAHLVRFPEKGFKEKVVRGRRDSNLNASKME